jgi:hypothetical protein
MENDMTTAAKKSGRPQKYADSAARQKAYRERMKAAGFREVKTMVKDMRDIDKPLVSDIIDLSQVRHR